MCALGLVLGGEGGGGGGRRSVGPSWRLKLFVHQNAHCCHREVILRIGASDSLKDNRGPMRSLKRSTRAKLGKPYLQVPSEVLQCDGEMDHVRCRELPRKLGSLDRRVAARLPAPSSWML